MKLLVISHTEHYTTKEGELVGWGPTVNELNFIASSFDKIYHIATLHEDPAPLSALPYTSKKIEFIPLKPTGGASISDKLAVVFKAPKTINTVRKYLKLVDIFQLRTPTGMGVYLIPYLNQYPKKKGWFKYAGNWNQKNPPLGYKIQRALLKQQSRKVTINGSWNDQPEHCYTFENPCLLEEDRILGQQISASKQFKAPYTFCFVGRLEDQKGVRRIIEAVSGLKDPSAIKEIHFVGNGADKPHYEAMAKKTTIRMNFHGFLGVKDVFEMYKKSHFFLLPSTASEGFPKVIAEAMNFGCIPIVSDVSAIPQYVLDKQNGFIVHPTTSTKLAEIINSLSHSSHAVLSEMSQNAHASSAKFTYSHYLTHLKEDIF